MVFFVFFVMLIITVGMKFSLEGEFNMNYMDKHNTTAINGIFVILIVFSHYTQYAEFSGLYDEPYLLLREHLNQLVVVTFLFYSGYGMMESLKNKGAAYIENIPNRFWQLLFRFDCAVALFWLLYTTLGTRFPIKRVLLAFTSWGSIGNSNWYIEAMLELYIFFAISFFIGKIVTKSNIESSSAARVTGLIMITILTLACIYFKMRIGRPSYTYNTMIIFPIGCIYSEFRNEIERFLMKNEIIYFSILMVAVLAYFVTFFHRWSYGIEGYALWTICFIALVILITMKVTIHNNLLEWFGRHVFSIYILQRLPMIVLDRFGSIETHKYMSLIAVFAITIPLALIFEKITDYLVNRIKIIANKC